MGASRALERAILRGPRPKAGTEGLRMALARFREELGKLRRKEPSSLHRSDPRADMKDAELDAADALVAQLQSALAPLEALGAKPQPFAEIAQQHRDAMDALLDPKQRSMRPRRASSTRSSTRIAQGGRIAVRPADYAEMFQAALADGGVVRPREQDVRVRIYGPLEARLQSVDRMVLGGLTEGVWPPETRADPWLSRPMRQELGLDLPERRIGLSAHDFAQALGAQRGGADARGARRRRADGGVALRAAARGGGGRGALERGDRARRAVSRLGARSSTGPTRRRSRSQRPEPKPPLEARPKSLSVTEIETLLRDPYSIYAQARAAAAPARRGRHAARRARPRHRDPRGGRRLSPRRSPTTCPTMRWRSCIRIGEDAFAPLQDFPDARAFWWPRFQRIARWFAQFETERRPRIDKLHAEIRGKLEIPLGDGVFTLRTRADRIEQLDDGSFAILDYKTGRVPTAKQVQTGLSPQLTLEAAILRAGGFGDIRRRRIGRRDRLRLDPRRRAARRAQADRLEGHHARRSRPTARSRKLDGRDRQVRRRRHSPISPRSGRCSCAAIPATTTIWRASRNGRCPAARTKTRRRPNEPARHPRRR